MNDTNKFAYTLTCNNTENSRSTACGNGSNIMVKETRNPQNINAEIRLFEGTYMLCVNIMKTDNLTILLSRTNLIHLQPDVPLLIQESKVFTSFNIYNPHLENLMI